MAKVTYAVLYNAGKKCVVVSTHSTRRKAEKAAAVLNTQNPDRKHYTDIWTHP